MPDISQITLPSGTTYDLKDSVARSAIAGGIGFVFAWTATNYASSTAPSSSVLATIPKDVKVYYNNGASYSTGTKVASSADLGKFYLIYSKTQVGDLDMYDEYVAAENGGTYSWEKLGDTQIDLSNVVTGVTLNQETTNFVTGYASPATDTVIGSNATFTVTQPTITLTSNASTATSGTAYVQQIVETTKKLATTTVTGVKSTTTTASKATAATSQTTATGAGTASSTNTDWLKGVSVSNEVLVIGAATMDTQTTTQFTFADVTVPVKADSSTTVATGSTGNSGGSDVLTGLIITDKKLTASASGGGVAWNSKDQVTALTGLGTASTSAGLNTSTSITVTKGS